jgi:hypothetical protein
MFKKLFAILLVSTFFIPTYAVSQGIAGAVTKTCARNAAGKLTCWVVANEAYNNYVGPGLRSAGRAARNRVANLKDPMYGVGNSSQQVYGRRNCLNRNTGTYYPC